MDESKDFEPGAYLSPSQIEIVKSKYESARTPMDQSAVVYLIDSFVVSNGKRTAEYSCLYDTMTKIQTMMSPSMNYPVNAKEGLPMMYAFAFYSYLVLVGVLTEMDIMSMQKKAADLLSGKGPSVPKA